MYTIRMCRVGWGSRVGMGSTIHHVIITFIHYLLVSDKLTTHHRFSATISHHGFSATISHHGLIKGISAKHCVFPSRLLLPSSPPPPALSYPSPPHLPAPPCPQIPGPQEMARIDPPLPMMMGKVKPDIRVGSNLGMLVEGECGHTCRVQPRYAGTK